VFVEGGNDILTGGAGYDFLNGGTGNDTYMFAPGDDFDIIAEEGGIDTLRITGGITLDGLVFTQVGNDLQIDIASGVTIKDQFSGGPAKIVEWVEFDDGSFFELPNPIMQTNQPPIAVGDVFAINEDSFLSANVMANDSDPDGDVLSVTPFSLVTGAGAAVEMLADGSFTYNPLENFNGADSFEYTLLDGQGGSDTATVSIDVLPVNDAPEAMDDTFSELIGQGISGNVLANDSDVYGDVLSMTAGLFATAQGGTLEMAEDGSFIYAPSGDFLGTDNFTYTVSDGNGGTDTAMLALTIELPEDAITGTDHRDILFGTRDGDTMAGDGGSDRLWGRSGADVLLGQDGRDHLYGGDGDDILYGGNDADKLWGMRGDDTLYGGNGKDSLWGANGNDVLYGGSGNDLVSGGNGDDVLSGGAGDDKLYGGRGDDIFLMGEGADKAYGGQGSDTFIFEAFDAKADTIYGFETGAGGDILNLTDILQGYDPLSGAITDFVQVTERHGHTEIQINVNGDSGGEFTTVAVVEGEGGGHHTQMTVADLLDAGNLVVDQSAQVVVA